MIAASKLSLKPCRAAQQGFHARKSVAAKRSKVSMPVEVLPRSAARFSRLGKRSPETEQGFPTRGNVPRKPSKVFPPGEMFLGNRARFSCLGKCSSETEQGFPIESTLNISLAWHVRCHGGRMRYAPTYLPFVRWGYGDASCRFVFVFRHQL